MTDADRKAIADSIRSLLVNAQTFEHGDVLARFLTLYPDSGRVISAASGAFTQTRDSLEAALSVFWEGAGRRMIRPRWDWGRIEIDVLSPNAAVVTAQYTVPHWTPDGAPHVVGGAWTSVWTRRDGRWVIVQEHLSDLPRQATEQLESKLRPLSESRVPN